MKRQVRPFVVEVKRKRGSQKPMKSIWGAVDLASIAAETQAMVDLTGPQLLDSVPTHVVSDHGFKPQAELDMPSPNEAETEQTVTEEPAVSEAPTAKKASRAKTARSTKKRAAKAEPAPDVQAAPARAGRKVYSPKERAERLSRIEKAIGGGDSVKGATAQAGISEQTYYQWKKAAAPAPSEGGELKDLVALEEENKRLKTLLAERLRQENAELRKKLGLN
ncbi:transposase [Aminobacter aganoensis]|uniref:Transposase n=1 Tax=Aminobacter aganoensis TaxID=83264 RepID=A0A7X0FCB1_9HYPH|nr:transposase [Aminobacter aganoensis]MBB6357107.1 hypothetical protein [Aminobacter aganoensis]